MNQPQLSAKIGLCRETNCKPSQHAKTLQKSFFRLSGSPIQFKCKFMVTESLWSVDTYHMAPLSLKLNYSNCCNKTTLTSFLSQTVNITGNFKTALYQVNKPDRAQEEHLPKYLRKIRLPHPFSKMIQTILTC